MLQYELKEKIGHGGMGLVYRAHDIGLDRDVAIKFMDPTLLHDKVCVERFLREAKLIARLDHPNVVRIFGAGTWEDGRPYFVMELIQGVPLTQRIRQGALPETEAIDIASQALGALADAHALGIIHRDIKSSNILLCPGGKVKLIDFGIARAEDAASVTSTGKVIGTPTYMSPEQAMGDPASAQSDLYSMGIVIYEMLSGSVPFRAETPVAILMMQANNTPPPLPGHISLALQSAVNRSLEKKLELRYASALEMQAALQGASQDPTMHTTAEDAFRPTPIPPTSTPPIAQTPVPHSVTMEPTSGSQPPGFNPSQASGSNPVSAAAPPTSSVPPPMQTAPGGTPQYPTAPPQQPAPQPYQQSWQNPAPMPTPAQPMAFPTDQGATKSKNTVTCLIVFLVCLVLTCIGTAVLFYVIGSDPTLMEPQVSTSSEPDPWAN